MISPGCGGGGSAKPWSSVALYIHVPFCRARCAYCDFNTYAGMESLIEDYVRALCREIGTAGTYWDSPHVSAVYIGGGTPSLVPLDLLSDLIHAASAAFDLSVCTEFTVEANPGTVTPGYLSGLYALGVSRLSLGVQSTWDDELTMLGRIHTWDDAIHAVADARRSGFQNLNLDLLFDLPGQSLDRWRETLKRALQLDPEHLSLYGLGIEAGTGLAERIERGELAAPEEDRAAEMYELAEQVLAEAGYFHYEISNWARVDCPWQAVDLRWWPAGCQPDFVEEKSEKVSSYVCRHNLTYWRNRPWLGVGAGAYSWLSSDMLRGDHPSGSPTSGERWVNVAHPEAYVRAAYEGAYPFGLRREVERIPPDLEMGETMMLGLRLAEGVRAERFEMRFGLILEEVFGEELRDLSRLGLLEWNGRVARLTERGRLLGNRVFECFI